MHTNPYCHALSLLGSDVAYLPIQQGTKRPMNGLRWKSLSLADTQRPNHIETLLRAAAIAVVLGPVSGDLIAIDFDTDEAAETFLSLNPALEGALRTYGARGCVLWLLMEGKYPACCKRLSGPSGCHVGEWRAGDCYSIITGEHKSGKPYTVLVKAPPMALQFDELRWPDTWHNVPVSGSFGSVSQNQTAVQEDTMQRNSACPSAWSEGEAGKGAAEKGEGEDGTLVHKVQVSKLYRKFVDEHWTPKPHERNRFIVEAIPFLYHAMCIPAVRCLVMRYYDSNRAIFMDSRETHKCEAAYHLRAVDARFVKGLDPVLSGIYHALRTEREKAAFRICKHLAEHRSIREDCEGDQFILSYEELGTRLLIDPKAAYKLMSKFKERGIVELVRNGTRRMLGVRGQASVWRFLIAPEADE